MAGLPGSKAIVSVGPPLFASGPSIGLMLVRLPVPVKATLASELKLQMPPTTAPKQLAGVLLARSVLAKTPESMVMPPRATPLVPDEPGLPGRPLREPPGDHASPPRGRAVGSGRAGASRPAVA